ncbi:hypothetical protein [Defluviitalea raffinosedens]|uniref:Regulatory protein YycH-like domain-containing protein n=1 Tax=Defluviitalea raffinosedens TaxID=1450156 RepID=A0A7C8LTS6_9FIRM|nr:hypothetical protein [Defluviitalea raffinosedens]KAE9635430.1 hypothetical protein GND95_04590 [Defluviitalea raffinosedens]MBM7684334.1 hypothetical protein [Defluviitalea raffinosedens]HHW67610.1 hypothetical protein [Candidatus Epulonipiscium sp.]
MDVRKINWFLILFTIIGIPFLYYLSENSGLLPGMLMNSTVGGIFNPPQKVVYDLNIRLENHLISRMKTYEVRGIEKTLEDAEFYREKLDIKNPVKENPTEYIIEDAEKRLIVSKNEGVIKYNRLRKNENVDAKISKEKAIEGVMEFIESLNLACHHQKSIIEDIPDQNMYHLRFVNTLEGILNYGYCTQANISYSGEILELQCYQLIYKSNETVSVKSIKEAYNELEKVPIDGENLIVDIRQAELVYTKSKDQNFLVEPAYRFFGEINQGGTFEYFIPAAYR